MHSLRFLFITIVISACMACASSSTPAPERAPRNTRLSIRNLNQGTIFYNKGCFTQAAQHFEAAHERFVAADDLQGTAESLNSLANAYYRLGDMGSAVLVYDEAAELYRQLGDGTGRIRALTNKSVALASTGKLAAAEKTLNHADELTGGKSTLTGLRLKARAILKLKGDDIEGARDALSKAIDIIPEKETGQFASAQYTMGYLLLSARKPREAIAYLQRALAADRSTEAYFGIGQDLEALGDCHAQLNQHAQAVTFFQAQHEDICVAQTLQKGSADLIQARAERQGIEHQR